MSLNEEQPAEYRELLARAAEGLSRAYAPHSGFPVAAVILTTDGREFLGVNIENASYGLSLCAERAALANMVASLGPSARIALLALVSEKSNPCYPCGACREMLYPFTTDNTQLLLKAEDGEGIVVLRFRDMLPHPFSEDGK